MPAVHLPLVGLIPAARSLGLRAIALSIALCGLSAASAQTLVAGQTPGNFAVSPSGAATYSIPIQVPPGVAGMEPKFSLSYSSQSGNGTMGMGWDLDGVSSIARCPRTMATDGVNGAVKLDINDRFCLDGQRLMVVAGAYGAAGSEYRTEFDSFSKLTANGAAAGDLANGPESFTVRTKGGLTLEYGSSADSRIEAQGKSVVAHWALKTMRDVKGNEVVYAYSEFNPHTSWDLASITYALNRTVRFTYELRPDSQTSYLGGSMTLRGTRLKTVETLVGSAVIQRTLVKYSAASNSMGSLVESVQTCDGAASTNCLAPVSLGWTSSGSRSFDNVIRTSHAGGASNNLIGDFNGDGMSDMTTYVGAGKWNVCLSTGSGFTCSQWSGHGAGVGGSVVGDFNGDGRTDIAGYTGVGAGWAVCLSTGGGFNCPGSTIHSGNVGRNVTGDFNGDGRDDMIAWVAGGTWRACMSASVGSIASFNCSDWAGHGGGALNNIVGDFNGDGLTDIAGYMGSNGNWHVCLSNGIGFTCSVMASHTGGMDKNVVGDFNGDGMSDMAGFLGATGAGVGPWKVCIATGTGFTCSDWTGHAGGVTKNTSGDFNGDGRTDLATDTGGGNWRVCLSSGSAFECSIWAGHGGGSTNNVVGDFNGDGLTDVAGYTGSAGNWHVSSPLATEIRRSAGFIVGQRQSNVAYKLLSGVGSSSVYTKDSDAVYPQQDVQIPLQVVYSSSQSNGLGGLNATSYAYGGLKTEHASAAGRGNGSLGFRWFKVREEATGLEVTTDHAQIRPYIGQSAQTVSRLVASGTNKLLKRETRMFGCYQTRGAAATSGCPANSTALVYFPFMISSTEESWDINGAVMPTVINTYAYAGYADQAGAVRQFGDPTQVMTEVRVGNYNVLNKVGGVLKHTKTTTNVYHPAKTAGTDWQLGRLKKATVTSTQY